MIKKAIIVMMLALPLQAKINIKNGIFKLGATAAACTLIYKYGRWQEPKAKFLPSIYYDSMLTCAVTGIAYAAKDFGLESADKFARRVPIAALAAKIALSDSLHAYLQSIPGLNIFACRSDATQPITCSTYYFSPAWLRALYVIGFYKLGTMIQDSKYVQGLWQSAESKEDKQSEFEAKNS